jgi:excinuclease UvrABC ATPase subunit
VSRRSAREAGVLRLRGLRAGNLRDLDLEIPHGAWTAIHGPSGAGKSALLFGVLEPVARRRFRVLTDPHALPDGDACWLARIADEVSGLTPVVAGAGEIPRSRRAVRIGDAWGLWGLLARAWERDGEHLCGACGAHWAPWRAETEAAGCADLAAGAQVLVFSAAEGERVADLLRAGRTRARLDGVGGLTRLEESPDVLPRGSWLLMDRLRWSPEQRPRLLEALESARRRGGETLLIAGAAERRLPAPRRCPACGTTLAEDAQGPAGAHDRQRWLHERTWNEWSAAPVAEWLAWCSARDGLAARRLELLERAGVGHLGADRTLGSLSLGEARRVELVSWLALVRSGQTVLLDEPGMGLHGRERLALAELLRRLAADGNTVLTADPAREFLEAAHGWVMLGPGGGAEGGRLVAQGVRAQLPPEVLPEPRAARGGPAPAEIRFRNLLRRHLRIPELALPLGRVVAICGPSGSGKSTLLEQEIVPRLRGGDCEGTIPAGGIGVLLERALHWAPVSTIATLSGAWEEVRELFAAGEEGRMRGLTAADLVARPGRGACVACGGHGAGAEGLPCGVCAGLGLRPDLTELRARGRSLRTWLTTPLAELEKRVPGARSLRARLRNLVALGLGPRCLGERARHLSLGERSRIALARALAAARPGAPRLFLLDEPCLGLPRPEAERVIGWLHELAGLGHSFWVVEHHEFFLRTADWLIEIGPGAGEEGGRLLHCGPPAELASKETPTAQWWRARAKGGAPPLPVRCASAVTRAMPGGFTGTGRAEMEEALRCELAMRSPLTEDSPGDWSLSLLKPPTDFSVAQGLTDGICEGPAQPSRDAPKSGQEKEIGVDVNSEGGQSPRVPVAWPLPPDPRSTLVQVLGLASLLPELRRRGTALCAACSGAGPWLDLAANASAHPDQEWVFAAPLPPEFLAKPELGTWLQAAGFQRLLRAGAIHRASRGAPLQPQPGDRVWLDRFAPLRDRDAPGRLRDLEHHLQALRSGALHAYAPDNLTSPAWQYLPGACRDCGAANLDLAAHLGGWNLESLDSRGLAEFLVHAAEHAADLAAFARASELLRDTSLLQRPCGTPLAALAELEQRLARLAGWLLFPPAGATLLLDQPLAGLPLPLACRCVAALLTPAAGAAYWFTDAEHYAASAAILPPSAPLPLVPRPADLAFDFDRASRPPRARAQQRLREALGLDAPLREHFLRTEGARLRGLASADLDPQKSPHRCPHCAGRGEERGHPALFQPCRACRGSGFTPEMAVAEDRGLRWTDLSRTRLAALAEHYAESPALGRVLEHAVALGLGELALDTPLRVLPLGARCLAPLAPWAAAPAGPREAAVIGLAAAGLSVLEARRLAFTIDGFTNRTGTPEWRDQHPAYAVAP